MQDDERLTIRVGQRLEQHAVDDAEDGRVGANAERHRHDDDHGETGIAAKGPDPVPHVLRDRFGDAREPRVPDVVLDPVHDAEGAHGGLAGRHRRHPGPDVLLGEHVEMEGQLCVELALVARTPEE